MILTHFIVIVSMLVVTFLVAIAPVFLAMWTKKKLTEGSASSHRAKIVNSIANAFGEGVFLCLLFITLGPEMPGTEEQFRRKYSIEFPLPIGQLATVCGAMLMKHVEMISENMGVEHGHSHELRERLTGENNEAEGGSVEAARKREKKPVNAFLFVSMISVHSFFEGIPMGLKATTSDILTLFWPLLIHKILEAITIGVHLGLKRKSTSQTVTLLAVSLYSLMSPLGVVFGLGLASFESSVYTDLIIMIFQGLSIGAVSFITFSEIMVNGIHDNGLSPTLKTTFSLVGFSTTLAITTIAHSVGHGHSHGDSHGNSHGHSHD